MGIADTIAIAEEMIGSFGAQSASMMERPALEHCEAGETEGAAFWSQVAGAARVLLLKNWSSGGPAAA